MNNDNKKLSRNRKERTQHKIKMDDKTKWILNEIQAERKERKNFDKI